VHLKEGHGGLPPMTMYNIRRDPGEKFGLEIGMAYTALSQQVGGETSQKHGFSGDIDIFGRWKFHQSAASTHIIGFSLEQRHKWSKIPPSDLNHYLDMINHTTRAFNTYNAALVELWWEQQFHHDTAGFRVGKIDITSVMDNYAFESQNLFFLNTVFTGHPGWAEPANGLGGAFGLGLTEHLYSSFALIDTNGSNTRSGFSTFGRGQYFTAIELGYRAMLRNTDKDNYHIFFWHADARPEYAIKSDQGMSLTLQKNIDEKYIPFFRVDINRGKASEYKQLIITGIGIYSPFNQPASLLGIAVSQGKSTDIDYGTENVIETFYRIQVTPYLQVTPDLQFIRFKPPTSKKQWATIGSLRFRIAA
jgi:hypothetical protein